MTLQNVNTGSADGEQNATLLSAQGVAKTFPLPAGGVQTVLEEVTFQVAAGEVVALLDAADPARARCFASLQA